MPKPADSALFWSSLHVLTRERHEALLQVYGDLDGAMKHFGEEMLRGLGCRQETIVKSLLRAEEFDVAAYRRSLEREGITFLSWSDAAYPQALRSVPDAPPFLYAKGDLSVLLQPCVALVGTRKCSSYGRRAAESITADLVHAGVVTISGLAQGIDGCVAEATLKAGGRTVAVLGHGLPQIYPSKHVSLAKEILKQGGLLLTEFPLGYAPDTYTFPARNRVVAGLSLATVVLEAPEGSGALITAELALDYGRDVFAVPGQIFDPNFAGCHDLIAQGHARLVTNAAEILQELGMVARPAKEEVLPPSDPEEARVFQALTTLPKTVDELMEHTGKSAASIAATLTILELQGMASQAGEGKWVRA